MPTKVTVIGAGHVGEVVAFQTAAKELVNEVCLIDIIPDMPKGKALDMRQSTPIYGSDTHLWGSNDFKDVSNSNIVVVTAGVPRKPGMSRMDLLKVNFDICKNVSYNIKQYAPNSIVIYVANPVDVLTYTCWKLTGFSHTKIFGMAGILDTARYRAFIAMEAKVSVKDIRAMVLGGHGDQMVPIVSATTVGGIPLSYFLPKEKIDAIVERTRKGGGEIVNLLKTGSAYYAPGVAVAEMIEAIVRDQKRVLPVVAYLNNNYGFSDVFVGAPALLGKDGVEKVLEIPLTDAEKAAYTKSASEVKAAVKELYDEKLL
jgi:malate dehydrogenase